MTISPSIAHKTKEVQELIRSSSFQVYDKVLPTILSPTEHVITNLFIQKGSLHQISKVPRKWFAKEAGCSKRTVSRTLSLLRSMDIIDAYYSFYEVITFKLGLYFKQPGALSKMASLFSSLKVVTPVLTSLAFLVSVNMSHYKVISNPVIYLKAKFFVSNTSKELLRSCKSDFPDPPPRKSMPFIPQGAKNNVPLHKQAIDRNQKLDDAMPYEEAKEKLRRYRQMLYAAQNENQFPDAAQQRAIDVYQREVNKWEQRVYNLNPLSVSLLESPKETTNLPQEKSNTPIQGNASKYDEYFP